MAICSPGYSSLKEPFVGSLVKCLLLFPLCLVPFATSDAESRPDSDTLQSVIAESKDLADRIPVLIRLSEQSMKTDLEGSVAYAKEAVSISEKVDDFTEKARSLGVLGRAHLLAGATYSAVRCFTRRLILQGDRDVDASLKVEGLLDLASVHLTLKEYLRAQHLLDSAWKLSDASLGGQAVYFPNSLRARLHGAYGVALMGMGDFPNAGRHLQEGIRIAALGNGMKGLEVWIMDAYGHLLVESGRMDSAIRVYDEALRGSTISGDVPGQAAIHWSIGNWHETMGMAAEAKRRYSDAHRLSDKAGATGMKERSGRSLARMYQVLGKMDSSLYHTSLADELKSKLDERKASEELMRQEFAMGLLRAGYEQSPKRDWRSGVLLATALLLFMSSGWLLRRLWLDDKPASSPVDADFVSSSGTYRPIPMDGSDHRESRAEKAPAISEALNGIALQERWKGIVDNLRACMGDMEQTRQADLKRLIREMESNRNESAWEELEIRFEAAYTGFLDRLKAIAPNLTSNERRLCLFLRMDMSTKDISRVTGQSLRAVELGRIRLRKKLNLTHTDSGLSDHLSGI